MYKPLEEWNKSKGRGEGRREIMRYLGKEVSHALYSHWLKEGYVWIDAPRGKIQGLEKRREIRPD